MASPVVSILIPAHNAASWLRQTLDSALAQAWPHKEIVVVENGSTDETAAVAHSYLDRGVKVVCLPVGNASAARNRAFKESSGDFIQYLDADDLLSPNKLQEQVPQLDQPSVLSLSARVEFFDGDDPLRAPVQRDWPFVSSTDPVSWFADLLGRNGRGNFIASHQWLVPRQLIEQAGPWDETLTVNDDGEFFSRVILSASEIRTALAATAYYRRHRSSRNLSSAFRSNPTHVRSMLRATDLVATRVLARCPDAGLRRALARHYYDCAFLAHSVSAEVSRLAEQKALALDPAAKPPSPTSKVAAAARWIVGWRAERTLAYHYRKLRAGG